MMGRLEKAANFAVILACVVFSARYGLDLYGRGRAKHSSPPYSTGDVIKDTPDLGLSRARLTVVLVTRSGCHFCSASMPFYRRMVDVAKRAGVRLLAATDEDPRTNEAYLNSNQVAVEAAVSTGKNQIRASGTPTLILVRNDGRVVNSWVGQLQEAREKEVLKAIDGGS